MVETIVIDAWDIWKGMDRFDGQGCWYGARRDMAYGSNRRGGLST